MTIKQVIKDKFSSICFQAEEDGQHDGHIASLPYYIMPGKFHWTLTAPTFMGNHFQASLHDTSQRGNVAPYSFFQSFAKSY